MKGIFKFMTFIVLLNFAIGASFLGWFAVSLFGPSFEGTGITLSDVFQKHLDPDKYKKLEKNLNERSGEMGKEAAETVIKGFKVLFPTKGYDFSKMPKVDYPYPSSDEVMELTNQNVQKGIEEGMKNLADMEKMNQEVKEATLSQ